MQDGDLTKPLGPALHMLAAAEAGVATLVLTNPIWVIKTRLCLQYGGPEASLLSEDKRYRWDYFFFIVNRITSFNFTHS